MRQNENPLLNMKDELSAAAGTPAPADEIEAALTDEIIDEKERRKRRRAAYIKIAAMLMFAGAVIAFSSIAWFTMNKDVSGAGMGVRVDAGGFELAVPARTGAETYYNDEINGLGYLTDYDQLSTTSGSIRWVMRDESTNNAADDYKGFHPGSYGKLEFYLVPKADVNAEYTFQLKMTGYYAEFEIDEHDEITKDIKDNTFQSLSEKANNDTSSTYALAANYLKGHIMFFQNHKALTSEELNGATDSNHYYSGRIIDSFTYNTATHQADKTTLNGKTAYLIQIYWIWPNTFSQILLDTDNANLYGNAMFSSKQSGSPVPRDELTGYIADYPGYYFGTTELAGSSPETLAAMMDTNSLNNSNALLTLSNGYNAADQIIGENVQFILVELVADQSNAAGN